MSEQTCVQLIRNLYDAVANNDMAVLDTSFSDDIEWSIPGRGPLSGVRHSKREVFDFFGQMRESVSGTFRLETHRIMGDGGNVVALVTEHAERNGKALSEYAAHVWELEGGKVTKFYHMPSDPYSTDDFWS